MLHRLPFYIFLNLKSSFCGNLYSSMCHTCIETDNNQNILLIGKPILPSGLIVKKKIETAHIILSCVKLGSKTIDKFGNEIKDEAQNAFKPSSNEWIK